MSSNDKRYFKELAVVFLCAFAGFAVAVLLGDVQYFYLVTIMMLSISIFLDT